MASRVGICNLALGWLGADLVTQLDVDAPLSTEEELCVANLDEAIKAVLEAKAWTFATEVQELTTPTDSGDPELPSAYALAATVLRVLAVDDGTGQWVLPWRRQGQAVVTNTSGAIDARVIVFEDDPTLYSPGFVRALAYRLAADLAAPLTSNVRLAAEMEAKYQHELRQAGALDGSQGSAETKRDTWLTRARGG